MRPAPVVLAGLFCAFAHAIPGIEPTGGTTDVVSTELAEMRRSDPELVEMAQIELTMDFMRHDVETDLVNITKQFAVKRIVANSLGVNPIHIAFVGHSTGTSAAMSNNADGTTLTMGIVTNVSDVESIMEQLKSTSYEMILCMAIEGNRIIKDEELCSISQESVASHRVYIHPRDLDEGTHLRLEPFFCPREGVWVRFI
jgi:hypothetical protein